MVDNGENILVEFDYDNISIIDPNKVIDKDGNVKERLVKQENLVFYANLECNVLPRTKLALGTALNDSIRTISVGKINFLNPGQKTFLDNSYTDEITGKGAIEGKGVNQPKLTAVSNPNKTNDYYITQSQYSNGKPGSVDNGLLGITSIKFTINTSFQPVIDIDLEDIKGRALFEAGDNSPYAAFFQLPYPIFYLTLKGYYGKAVRFPIMLQNFTSSFDPSTHNFRIKLRFYGYKYTIMSSINWGGMLAVPHMYNSTLKIPNTTTSVPQPSQTGVTEKITSKGYEKMKELYAEYKSKGLIADDFPEITITQLKTRLDTFLKDLIDKFTKENLAPLTDIENYLTFLDEYNKEVYSDSDSWAKKYLDFSAPFVLNDTDKTKIYIFKKEINAKDRVTAINELQDKLISKFTDLLKNNIVLGQNGKYVINGKETPSEIPNTIVYETFVKNNDIRTLLDNGVDLNETYLQRNNGKKASGDTVVQNFKEDIKRELKNVPDKTAFWFEGKTSFIDQINEMNKKVKTTQKTIEDLITKTIQEKFTEKNNAIGFIPTVRNVMAVFFAQAEAFLRLMDDVHTAAWEVRNDKTRKQAVFNKNSSAPSVDYKDVVENDTPVYPWPQLIVESVGDDKEEKFELKYPGDLALASALKAFVPEIWPEVEFVEEFIKGYTERESPEPEPDFEGDVLLRPDRISLNALDFPVNNEVYQNVQEVKFFYEIYERLIMNSFYSRLNRKSGNNYGVYNVESEAEKESLVKALGDDNPFLTKKIKEYNINAGNFLAFLRHISNQGEGESWQKFIRGEFTTPYIKNEINIPTSITNQNILLSDVSKPNLSISNETNLNTYLQSPSASNVFEFGDLYPIVNLDYVKKYLADGKVLSNSVDAYKTSDVILFNTDYKSITNFLTADTNDTKRPFTNFNFKGDTLNKPLDLSNLKTFYQARKIEDQFVTEGNINYMNYSGSLIYNQTTSMLNTPYFVNAIQTGVNEFRFNTTDLSSYKLAAYLFLNSLPLATLKEKYRTFNATTDLSYLLSTFKKFGAIHKLPYAWVLKYGSVWYRYKKWKETGNDILDDVWKNFDYSGNYDPATSAKTKNYSITAYTNPYEIILQNTIQNNTNINLGFYPKVLDDFNVFYQGTKLFTGGTQLNGTCSISGTTFKVETVSDNILAPGQILFGNNILQNTQIVSQVSGTTGGTGEYIINFPQTVPSGSIFVIPNAPKTAVSSSSIQTMINDGSLYVIPSDGSKIIKQQTFDPNNLSRSLNLKTWSVLSLNSTKEAVYVLPSFGSNINQINSECFNGAGNLRTELNDNTAMYNGSVRSFWLAPHYGYFDNDKLLKPNPEEYFKQILNEQRTQQNFLIDGDNTKYSKIDEMFSTFDKSVLDLFETEFLNFSRSSYDYKTTIGYDSGSNSSITLTTNQPSTETESLNFQFLMRALMKVTKPTQTIPDSIITEISNLQKDNFIGVLTNFLNYNVILRIGNPTNFDKKLYYSFSTQYLVDPITYQGYNQTVPGYLPFSGGNITLAQSKNIYPQTWKTLETYVGFSEIPELKYTDNGSYITDFFIDVNVEFNETNVKDFAPLIKIYATEKLKDPTFNGQKFIDMMNTYIDESQTYIDNVVNVMMPAVRASLKDVTITRTAYDPNKNVIAEQTKLELWDLFKTINDTWIAGYDFKTKTLFEDVLLFDRASRDVGQKIILDIFKIKELIDKRQYDNNFLDIINTILTENNFVYFNLPSFSNFYNVQDAQKKPIPKPEGTLEFANSLFGTFLNLDYRETSPKLVCYYANKNSEHLDMKNNVDYRFRNDAFDLRRSSDNPLVQNLQNKQDWDKSNRVVGFNIDIGIQNQQIFKSFDVSQTPGKPTSESLEVLNQMANIDKNRKSSTQNNSLYNLYKNRSYACSVDMLGNALIQPMMYFNLRNVPMFSGPYLITSVSHSISENGFDTQFEGTRQPFYALPKIENFIQTLSSTILKSIREKIQQKDREFLTSSGNVLTQKNIIVDNALGNLETLTPEQNCFDKLAGIYRSYTKQDTPQVKSVTFLDAKKAIYNRLAANLPTLGDSERRYFAEFIFSAMYVDNGTTTGFSAYDWNFSTINLTTSYGQVGIEYFDSKYFCVSKGQSVDNLPLASFKSLNDYLDFFINKFAGKSTLLNDPTITLSGLTEIYIMNWPLEQPANVYDSIDQTDKKKIEDKFLKGSKTFNQISYQPPTPTPTPTPTP